MKSSEGDDCTLKQKNKTYIWLFSTLSSVEDSCSRGVHPSDLTPGSS